MGVKREVTQKEMDWIGHDKVRVETLSKDWKPAIKRSPKKK